MRDVKINEIIQFLCLLSENKVSLIKNPNGEVIGFLDTAYDLSEAHIGKENKNPLRPVKIEQMKENYEISFLPKLDHKFNNVKMSVQLVAKSDAHVTRRLKVLESEFVPLDSNNNTINISRITFDIKNNHIYFEITDNNGLFWTNSLFIDTEEGDWLETDHYNNWQKSNLQSVG